MNKQLGLIESREIKYQAILPQVENIIISLKDICREFRIGKTGMTKEERFNEPDYRDTYSNIIELYSSDDKDEISRLERDLILRFEKDEKCDNERKTDQDDMRDSERYTLYMVYK